MDVLSALFVVITHFYLGLQAEVCRKLTLFENLGLPRNTFYQLQTRNIQQCSRLCTFSTGCEAIAFCVGSKMCYLLELKNGSIPTGKSVKYAKKTPLEPSHPCYDHRCGQHTTCNPTLMNSDGYRCRPLEPSDMTDEAHQTMTAYEGPTTARASTEQYLPTPRTNNGTSLTTPGVILAINLTTDRMDAAVNSHVTIDISSTTNTSNTDTAVTTIESTTQTTNTVDNSPNTTEATTNMSSARYVTEMSVAPTSNTHTCPTLASYGSPVTGHRDCKSHYDAGVTTDGVYEIYPDGYNPVRARCDMTEGGWTVFQERYDGSQDFNRTWHAYRSGFGDPNGEYWLGLENVYQFATLGSTQLRVRLMKFGNPRKWNVITFTGFSLGPCDDWYRLSLGRMDPSALCNSLAQHDGQPFSTYDQHDHVVTQDGSCLNRAGWWYHQLYSCLYATLNQPYVASPGTQVAETNRVMWYCLTAASLEKSEMSVKRV